MQTFSIVVRLVKLDVLWGGRRSQVVDEHMLQSVHLYFEAAEHRVLRVAGIAGLVNRHAVILIM